MVGDALIAQVSVDPPQLPPEQNDTYGFLLYMRLLCQTSATQQLMFHDLVPVGSTAYVAANACTSPAHQSGTFYRLRPAARAACAKAIRTGSCVSNYKKIGKGGVRTREWRMSYRV